jgi:UPF0716 protein FxsA
VLRLGKWIAIGLLALPPVEILVFMLVSAAIGLVATLALMVTATIAGVMVLRRAGQRRIVRLRAAVAEGKFDGRVVRGSGAATVAAGILLIIPGFVSDLMGALLLVPWVRRRLGATIRHAVMRAQRRDNQPGVIDLDPGEWQRLDDRRPRKPRKSRPKQADGTNF